MQQETDTFPSTRELLLLLRRDARNAIYDTLCTFCSVYIWTRAVNDFTAKRWMFGLLTLMGQRKTKREQFRFGLNEVIR